MVPCGHSERKAVVGVYTPDQCRVCWKYMNEPHYKEWCDSEFISVIVNLPSFAQRGPGTELKKLLAKFGITGSSCNCSAHATEMDQKGSEWCTANIDTIIGWLREEAGKRSLPFVELAARILVKRAIKLSRMTK